VITLLACVLALNSADTLDESARVAGHLSQ